MFNNFRLYILLTATIISACTKLNKEDYNAREKLEKLRQKYINEENLSENIIKNTKPRYIECFKTALPQEYINSHNTYNREMIPVSYDWTYKHGRDIFEYKGEKNTLNLDMLFDTQIKKDLANIIRYNESLNLFNCIDKFLMDVEKYVPNETLEKLVNQFEQIIETKISKVLGTNLISLIRAWGNTIDPILHRTSQNIQNRPVIEAGASMQNLMHIIDYSSDIFVYTLGKDRCREFYSDPFLPNAINLLAPSSLPYIS